MKENQMNPIFEHKSLEEIKYRELFKVTEKFHSTMNINSVLEEIIQTLKRVFPKCDYYLLLSNDHDASAKLPIKSLEYNSGNPSAITAYVNGTVELEHSEYPVMYAPLKGKQGVYGVLQVKSLLPSPFENSQTDFVRILANTAGNALENAKLYQQSQKLIEDLRLIDEISQKLNSTSNLSETISYLYSEISKSFSTSQIGFVLIENEEIKILDESSSYFKENAGMELIHVLLEKTGVRNESLYMADIKGLSESVQKQFGSLMAVPMIHNDSIRGIVIALGDEPFSFTFEMFRLFQSLIQRSSLAVANSMLRGRLEKMVITDQLTQLYARNYLNDKIEESMKRDREGTFILIDLDDFKEINDTYGHQTGDEVLMQVADIIRGCLRPNDVGSRWGGEELAVYLPSVPLNNGVRIAERLLKRVSEKTKPSITMSCGISHWNSSQDDAVRNLFSRADAALYKAKNSGKNQMVIQSL